MKTLLAPVLSCLVLCGLLTAPSVRAGDSEDWWNAYREWNQRHEQLATAVSKENIAAQKEKRPSQAPQMYRSFYEGFLEFLGTGKGHRDWRLNTEMSLQVWLLEHPVLGGDLDTIEKTMRELWQKQYKPDRRSGFAPLYKAFMREKRYKDAARVAEECYKEYEWEWSSRDWLDNLIVALSNDPEAKPRLVARIDEYAKAHVKELDAWKDINKHLGYLVRAQDWNRGGAIVRACLRVAKDCDWEPLFLGHAVNIFIGRASVGLSAPAAPDAKAAPGAAAAAPADDSVALVTEFVRRCITRYPNEPEAAGAVLVYLQWAIAGAKDHPEIEAEAGRTVAAYLKARPTCPLWERLRIVGLKTAQSGEEEWKALSAWSPELLEEAKKRQETFAKLKAEDPANNAETRNALRAFIGGNPETLEARTATTFLITTMRGMALRTPWETDIPATAQTIRMAFPDSPPFRSEQLQSLGGLTTEAYADFVFNDLIQGAESSWQREHYHSRNNQRYLAKLQYNMEALKNWQKSFPESYGLAAGFAGLCQQAVYTGKPQDAARACDWMTNERYLTSVDVARCFASCIHSWLTAAMTEDAAKAPGRDRDRERGRGKGADKGGGIPNATRQSYARKANEFANVVDRNLSARYNLGFLYYHAIVWDKDVRFAGQGNMVGRDVLRTKPFQYTSYYYHAAADKEK